MSKVTVFILQSDFVRAFPTIVEKAISFFLFLQLEGWEAFFASVLDFGFIASCEIVPISYLYAK